MAAEGIDQVGGRGRSLCARAHAVQCGFVRVYNVCLTCRVCCSQVAVDVQVPLTCMDGYCLVSRPAASNTASAATAKHKLGVHVLPCFVIRLCVRLTWAPCAALPRTAQILAGRSEKRQLGSRKGNTFSIAHFAAAGAEPEQPEAAAEAAEGEGQPADPKAFWAGLLPEAVQAHEAALAAAKEPEVRRGGSSSS